MSELKPLDIVDNRTELEKLDKLQACGYCLMARGEWTGPVAHWLVNETSACDADILRIARERNGECEWLLPALVDIADRNQGQMVKMDAPCPCELYLLCQEKQQCTGLAYWRASGFAECDECIVNCLEHLPDNREWLSPALTDIRERHLKVSARVRIQCVAEQGQLGTVYGRMLNETGWYVHPDRRGDNQPGIACLPDELDVML